MNGMSQLVGKYGLWLLLAAPSAFMLPGLAADSTQADLLLRPTGEFAARFMIVALLLTPLRMLFPRLRWLVWLVRQRRALGVAAFGYALLHTVLYVVDMETLHNILAEFWALGIWTGWAAFVVLVALGATSNDFFTRRLGRAWKPLHRAVYAAALLTLAHWIFVHNNWVPALVHFAPLATLQAYRIFKLAGRAKAKAGAALLNQ